MIRRAACLLALAAVTLLSGCSWFDFNDPEPDEPAELVDFDETLEVRRIWKTGVGDGANRRGINLSPAYADGQIFAADHEGKVFALDAESGRVNWRVDTEVPVGSGPGLSDDLVLLGAMNGQIVALSRTDGNERWRASVSSEVIAAPVEHNDVVVTRSVDGRVFGFDADSGERLWIYDRSVPLLTLRGNSTPLARAGQVYIGYDSGEVVALRVSDGAVAWEQPIIAAEGRSELERLVDIDGSMALVATDLYVASYKGRVAGLAAESGRLLWFKDIASATGVAVSRLNMAVTDREGSIWSLDRRSGATQWKLEDLARRGLTAPAFYNDQVVVGDAEGYLHWIDLESGEFTARQKLDGDGFASAPLAVGNTLYVLTYGGDLEAYRAGAAL